MTAAEIKEETQYRIEERLGILCEDREPTIEQLVIALNEAEEFEKLATAGMVS